MTRNATNPTSDDVQDDKSGHFHAKLPPGMVKVVYTHYVQPKPIFLLKFRGTVELSKRKTNGVKSSMSTMQPHPEPLRMSSTDHVQPSSICHTKFPARTASFVSKWNPVTANRTAQEPEFPRNRGPVKRKFHEDVPEFTLNEPSSPCSPIDVYHNKRLENTGNSCYFNSTMQALSACSPLIMSCWRLRLLDENDETRNLNFGFLDRGKFKVLEGFLKMMITLGIPNDDEGFAVLSDFGPRQPFPQFTGEQLFNLRMAVGQVNNDFNNSEQQDAHEFLVTVLGIIDDLMDVIANRDTIDLNAESTVSSLNPASHFQIMVETVYRCQKCGTRAFKTEPRNDLSRVIIKETTIKNLLSTFTKWSVLEKTCKECNHAVSASCGRIVIHPRCLMITLKRYERVGDVFKKNSCSVKPTFYLYARKTGTVPELDLRKTEPKFDKNPGSIKYMFSSVICHEGVSLENGHFICFTKGAYDGK